MGYMYVVGVIFFIVLLAIVYFSLINFGVTSINSIIITIVIGVLIITAFYYNDMKARNDNIPMSQYYGNIMYICFFIVLFIFCIDLAYNVLGLLTQSGEY